MEFASRVTFFLLFLWVAPLILEVFLARTRSKIPGLILPALSFLVSLIQVFSVAAYGGFWNVLGTLLIALLFSNIMTILLLLIYVVCRRRRGKKEELDKMSIQDL